MSPTLLPLPTPRGNNLEPPNLTDDEILEAIGQYVPGFGGIRFDPELNALVVCLDDESELERAKEVMAAYYGDDRVSGNVITERCEFAMVDLAKWYREAQNIVWPLGGVLMTDLDEGKNRIEFGMNTAKAAERARAALSETDIPADAVYFDVAPLAHNHDLPVLLRAPNGVEIRLELPESVVAGETAVITVILTNTSNRDLELEHSPAQYQDLFVFGANGIEVWSKLGGIKVIPMIGASTNLAAGKSISFDTRWAAENNDRETVEPGEYRVQATFSLWERGSLYETSANLVTEPQIITVLPD